MLKYAYIQHWSQLSIISNCDYGGIGLIKFEDQILHDDIDIDFIKYDKLSGAHLFLTAIALETIISQNNSAFLNRAYKIVEQQLEHELQSTIDIYFKHSPNKHLAIRILDPEILLKGTRYFNTTNAISTILESHLSIRKEDLKLIFRDIEQDRENLRGLEFALRWPRITRIQLRCVQRATKRFRNSAGRTCLLIPCVKDYQQFMDFCCSYMVEINKMNNF